MSKYNSLIREDCEYLLKSAIVYLIVTWELSLCRWITAVILELIHAKKAGASRRRSVFIRFTKPTQSVGHSKQQRCWFGRRLKNKKAWWFTITVSDRGRSDARRRFIQISDLSSCCQGSDLTRKRRIRGIRVWFRRIRLRNGEYFQGRQQVRKLPNSESERQWQYITMQNLLKVVQLQWVQTKSINE